MRRICLVLLLLMFFVLPAFALEFVTETVDEGSMQGIMTSLAREIDGTPHMVFPANGSMKLQYATFDGENWTTQTIPVAAGYLSYPSIALDNDGNPHVAFMIYNFVNYEIIYAYKEDAEWVSKTVKAEEDSIKNVFIAVDSEGLPHIGYQTTSNDGVTSTSIKYVSRSGDTWQDPEIIVSFDHSCNNFVMALDNQDNPHLVYEENYNNSPHYYLTFNGESWTDPQLMQGVENVESLSLTVDSTGTPHISYEYEEYNPNNLKYAFLSGDEWETFTVDPDESVGQYSSIQVDSDGNVHISYYDNYNGDLKYAFFDGSIWTHATVDSQDFVGEYTSLALDASENPAISYYDDTNKDLKYASFDGENWTVQAIPPSGLPTGYYPDMVLDSSENPHMVYTYQSDFSGDDDDDDDSQVLYAYHDGTEWQKSVIAMGNGASLAMDGNDVPHVMYGNSDYSELKYGVLTGDSWNFETVVSADGYSSLALEGDGTPHISFLCRSSLEPGDLEPSVVSNYLWYAVKSGDIWDITSLDQEGNVWMNVLDLDSNNIPHIAYYDSNSNTMKYTEPGSTDGSWDIQIISSDIFVETCDLALDNSGVPHIALIKWVPWVEPGYDKEASQPIPELMLIYATLVNDEWVTESIDSFVALPTGRNKISIDLDSNNNPHITYRSVSMDMENPALSEQELKYAFYDGSTWHTAVLETGNPSNFGLYSSLALDSGNIPHIAYFTGTGVNYMTAPEETRLAASGGNCGVASFSPAMAMLLLPLIGLIQRKK